MTVRVHAGPYYYYISRKCELDMLPKCLTTEEFMRPSHPHRWPLVQRDHSHGISDPKNSREWSRPEGRSAGPSSCIHGGWTRHLAPLGVPYHLMGAVERNKQPQGANTRERRPSRATSGGCAKLRHTKRGHSASIGLGTGSSPSSRSLSLTMLHDSGTASVGLS